MRVGDAGVLPVDGRPTLAKPLATPGPLMGERHHGAGFHWSDGVHKTQGFINCLSDPPSTGWVESYVGFYGRTNAQGIPDGSYPKTGDLYYVHLVTATVGNVCAGGSGVTTRLALPAGTVPYIDNSNPDTRVSCWYTGSNGQTSNATNDPNMYCPTNPQQFSDGWWDLKGRVQPNYTISEIIIPVVSFRKLTTANDKVTGYVYENVATGTTVYPDALLWVPHLARLQYPNPAATSVTSSTARTNATVYNYYEPGQLYFDIGTSTSYGTSSSAIAIPNADYGYNVYMDWSGLAPSTTYHFRARFVTTSGTYLGQDQTFTTPAGPPGDPGGPVPGPGDTDPTPPPGDTDPTPPPGDDGGTGDGGGAGGGGGTGDGGGGTSGGGGQTTPGGDTSPAGPAATGLRVSRTQRGSVAGQVNIAQNGSSFLAELLGSSSQVASARLVRVGRTAKRGVSAGVLRFRIGLTAKGKRALRRKRTLKLTLRVAVTPPGGGAPARLSRRVTLRR
jgi:uncharacterized membrane protein YgcG